VSLGVGVVGCGDISEIYLLNAKRFCDIRVVACADIDAAAARRQAGRHGVPACGVAELLRRDDVDIVLNLTIPGAHAEVSLAAIEAGKHVYSEKPLATTVVDGAKILAAAGARGLRVGAAPDTILGAGYQTARRALDGGMLGRPLTAFAFVLSHGMEHWHPNPGFFFRKGVGPVLDMGPYYVSALVSLLGPVASVQAVAQIGFAERVVSTPGSALLGQSIRVETPTSVQALLDFASGAQAIFAASWDVWKHSLPPIEIHGELASLRLPDPNWFGGRVEIAEGRGGWRALPARAEPFSAVNWPLSKPVHANHRGLGLADMARAIIDDRPHRANGALALHALAVMAGMLDSAAEGRKVDIATDWDRPQPLAPREAKSLLRGQDRTGLS
jgi:predicted dehydrogenase